MHTPDERAQMLDLAIDTIDAALRSGSRRIPVE